MNTVQPIRDLGKVNDIYDYLSNQNKRNGLLFAFGIYTGLRISDILCIKVRQVRNQKYLSIRERKTGKEKNIRLNQFLKEKIDEYIADMKNYEYLFYGEKKTKPMTRQQAYNILSKAAEKFGVGSVGTHTLRKTFGYHMYQKTHDVALLMDVFNHDDPSVTLRYIGVNQDTKDKLYLDVDLLQ